MDLSGRQYVWDQPEGIARPARSDDKPPYFPTMTRTELAKWRAEFAQSVTGGLSADQNALVRRWAKENLRTAALPAQLQPRWNREMTRRVRRRLMDFFSSIRRATEIDLQDASTTADREPEPVDEIAAARDAGDFFSVGELLATKLHSADAQAAGPLLARIAAAWAAPKGPLVEVTSPVDLLARLGSISEENAAAALINAVRRLPRGAKDDLPVGIGDLAYRLRDAIARIYGVVDQRSPTNACAAAAAKVEAALYDFESSVQRFLRTSPETAKGSSVEVLKKLHPLQPMLVPAEREFLHDLEVIIGPAFRRLFEAYERNDDAEVLRRAPEFLANVKSHTPVASDPRFRSGAWNSTVAPILGHVSGLVTEAMSRGEVALAPILKLRNGTTKADLRHPNRPIYLSFALRNSGRGHAHDVSLRSGPAEPSAPLTLVEPAAPFDVAPGGEQLVRLKLILSSSTSHVTAPVTWLCQTSTEKETSFADKINVNQQVTEPNWAELITSPPYSLNPIRRPDRLYGRDATLQSLILAAMSGASKFVWGQKRIGKTSLLQVLATKLSDMPDTKCVLFRMGEIGSLHEGELARLIAQRLAGESDAASVPPASEFGAGMGRLVPFVEGLVARTPKRKLAVVIDEFDDLDPTFYTGERGKQFVKSLRSLSEVGVTFFFVGSERMEAIFTRHQADLNKWTNVKLDRIDSHSECRSLIINPVAGELEFSDQAVDFIIDYCGGNPFYINNFCYQIFERCLQEHRTFVDDNDTDAVRHQLLRALGATNFSHFWEDNPLLTAEERRKASAENCIALACISILGGRYEDQDELLEAQHGLSLSAALTASDIELSRACARLTARGILCASQKSSEYSLALKIFREWLSENAVSKLVPIWIEHKENERSAALAEPVKAEMSEVASDLSGFVIAEDDILAVSQRLMYCGRQKDVAELRSWLRQFDDDARIEVAFLLLKRLADKGFINEGMKSLALGKLDEIIKSRRLEVGGGAWKIERGRFDNLCLTYVDSELKSGASTTRDLKNMLRPGKSGQTSEIATWMRTHIEDDPMVVVVDDFAGSGATLAKGIERFRNQTDRALWRRYCDEGRISVVIMFAFPEAIDHVRKRCPGIHVVPANILGDELRACGEDADIFEGETELRFARDVLLQIGRELYPSAPLGFGDIGGLVAFHNTVPNNTLPIFWSNGRVGDKEWKPIFPRP
ncbi:phosphoribosyltransferase-like protein [Bradyrhizobium sp. 1200_D9_N1_1]|uniref:phosphoribosyltransferase-like protein n=1 Tax=Bradyrhizobium sp. 1200_D9_N1_1 TaxID=3239013 RepID=UPI003F8B6333